MEPLVNRHPGTVLALAGGQWQIELARPAGCGSCHGGRCGQSGEKRIVLVPEKNHPFTVGQAVWITVPDSSGWRAIGLFYAAPSILMIGILIGAVAAGVPEGMAGAAALLALVPYYFSLALTRKRWNDRICLTVQTDE